MDLKSGYPYWAIKNGLMCAFPRLESDIRCDVVVIGAGVTGALIARALAAEQLDVVVVDERDIAWGSTAASTALLQYEIDSHMTDLAHRYGEAPAALVYESCATAIGMLRDIAAEVRDVGFSRARSLYVASRWLHKRPLRREYEMRSRHGIEVDWLSGEEVRERFGVRAPCALLSAVAACMDPYRFTSRLLRRLGTRGVRIFDRTRVERLDVSSRQVVADAGTAHIRARYVVMATGYAAQQWLRERVAVNRSSYACATDPIDRAALGPWRDTLLWESARPYFYARPTSDNRLLIGGEDDAIDIPALRDRRLERKVRKLERRAAKFFPDVPVKSAFAWAGTFAETPDGLPYFGAHAQYGPRVLFAMAYGGNGITYSALGGDLLAASIKRRRHPLATLFGFARSHH
jgi:glycine/D-amino acid oxidase-like deaminating enzyme